MGLSSLKHLKKDKTAKASKNYVNTVIVGKSPYTILLWNKLAQKKNKEELLLISRDKLTLFDLTTWGPSSLRGQKNLDYYKALFPLDKDCLETGKSVFFKDLEFRDFSGRHKPETLLYSESFFTQKSCFPDLNRIFPYHLDMDFLNQVNEVVCTEIVSKIEKITNESALLDGKKWLLSFASGNQVECENLVWGAPVFELFEVMNSTSLLDLRFIEFFNKNKNVSSLFLRFEVTQASPMIDTFFIPLSYTHEWGHFVGEFQDKIVELVHFLDKESVSEDEIAKRIKIFKRSFEKIFPQNKVLESTEFIYFSSESPTLTMEVTDYTYENCLFFVGINAPLEKDDATLFNMARALASVNDVSRFLGEYV